MYTVYMLCPDYRYTCDGIKPHMVTEFLYMVYMLRPDHWYTCDGIKPHMDIGVLTKVTHTYTPTHITKT